MDCITVWVFNSFTRMSCACLSNSINYFYMCWGVANTCYECGTVVGHIKKTDGFTGLYRGLLPRLISNYVNGLVSASVSDVSFSYCMFLCSSEVRNTLFQKTHSRFNYSFLIPESVLIIFGKHVVREVRIISS